MYMCIPYLILFLFKLYYCSEIFGLNQIYGENLVLFHIMVKQTSSVFCMKMTHFTKNGMKTEEIHDVV